MADKKERDHQISIPSGEAHVIRTMARVAGQKHGIQGNFRGFVRSIASGQRGVVEVNETAAVWDLFQTVNAYIFGCNPFKLEYQNEQSQLVDLEITNAVIDLNPVRGWYLIASSPTPNRNEIPSLHNNHTVFLRQVVALKGLSSASWIPEIASVSASFWVSNVFEYREIEGDSQQSIDAFKAVLPERCRRSGIVVTRPVRSSLVFDLALRNYTDSYVFLPLELKNAINARSSG
jgi:hypothetical protein